MGSSDHFEEKLNAELRFYEERLGKIDTSYTDLIEELAKRTQDQALAQTFRLIPSLLNRILADARSELQRGDVVAADQELERAKKWISFLQAHLQKRYVKTGHSQLKGASEAGKKRAEKSAVRNRAMAEEFKRRRATTPEWKSDTAIKTEIGKERGIESRSAAIEAINAGLKILSG
jgi:hypothetical protein